MRVATYNFHDCVGRDARFDPGGIAEVLWSRLIPT